MKKRSQMWNVFRSFYFAFSGLWAALRQEPNIWIQVLIGFSFTLIAISNNRLTSAGINFTLTAFIIALEMVNTAIEALCDLVDEKQNPKIKFIKDVSAGAVLIAAITWGLILVYLTTTIFFPEFGTANFNL